MLETPWILVVSLVIVLAWIVYFAQMMSLADTDFPGKYDKILWFVVFVLLFVVAPFAFWIWKNCYLFDERGIQKRFRQEAGGRETEKADAL